MLAESLRYERDYGPAGSQIYDLLDRAASALDKAGPDSLRTAYRNIWCILRSLDLHEIEAQFAAGPLDTQWRENLCDWHWPSFRDDPHVYFLTVNDTIADCIWRAVMARMPK